MSMCAKHKKWARERLAAMYGEHCWLCHKPIINGAPTLDHVIPRAKGGSSRIENLRLAHRACNTRRGDGPPPTLKLRKDMILIEQMAA